MHGTNDAVRRTLKLAPTGTIRFLRRTVARLLETWSEDLRARIGGISKRNDRAGNVESLRKNFVSNCKSFVRDSFE